MTIYPGLDGKYHILYRTTNRINGKEYVGAHSTDDPDDGYMGSGPGILAALRKYGKENFICEILSCHDTRKEAFDYEKKIVTREYIKGHNYNQKEGGEGKCYPSWGKKRNIESRQKMSDAAKGRKASDETRQKLSKVKDGKNNSFYGKSHSDESRRRMSEAAKGRSSPRKGQTLSRKTKRKISIAGRGRILSKDRRQKISNSLKQYWQQRR